MFVYRWLVDGVIQSEVGCSISDIFVGALAYVDDIRPFAPSASAIYGDNATEHSISFNASKSQCLIVLPFSRRFFCTTLWIIVLFTLVIIQLNMSIHLLALIPLLFTNFISKYIFVSTLVVVSNKTGLGPCLPKKVINLLLIRAAWPSQWTA